MQHPLHQTSSEDLRLEIENLDEVEEFGAEITSDDEEVPRKRKASIVPPIIERKADVQFVPDSEDFMIAMLEISTLAAVKFPNLFSLMKKSIESTNLLMKGLMEEDEALLQEVYSFIETGFFTDGMYCAMLWI